jgi:hypothetical protein
MAEKSRTGLHFIRRHGLLLETLRPAPRIDVTASRVHTVPLANPPLPSLPVLRGLDGATPADRNVTRAWPEGEQV